MSDVEMLDLTRTWSKMLDIFSRESDLVLAIQRNINGFVTIATIMSISI